MIRRRGLIAVALWLLAALLPAAASERIRDYRVEVQVLADGQLEVTEHIRVAAAGSQIRRGIYRDFPTRYRDRGGNAVVVDLEVLGVERDGRPEAWFTERRSNGVRINTGGDNFLPQLPGEYVFTLRYRTNRQLGFFERHDELYWNAIGTGWAFPIDTATVEVRLPQPVPAADLAAEAYTGPQGAQGQDYRADIVGPGHARWQTTRALQPQEGLTIVLSFPKGLIAEPGRAQKLRWLLADNAGLLVALAGFALLLAFCIWRWNAVGRDPRPGIIIARYEPPADRSPAELRFLRRRNYDTRCFTADLLGAAVAGSVEIESERGLLFGQTWKLGLTPHASPQNLPPAPRALVGSLLTPAAPKIELKRGSATAQRLQACQLAHAKVLNQRLHGSHFHRNSGSAAAAFGIGLGTGLLAFAASGGNAVPAIIAVCVLMLLVVIAFGWLVQAPTAEGRKLLDEIEGLKLYLGVAERDELASVAGPDGPPQLDAARYEALLPYAIALDVEEAWSRKFTLAVGAAAAAAATAGITWYRGGGFNDLGSLAKAVGSGLNSSIASASTPPGSSSGSGGGGSSGGGGGGGGGGGR